MIAAAITPKLDLRNGDNTRLTFRRPMLGMNAAKAVTGFDEDEVMSEIHTGRIKWAFNLSTTTDRMFVVILTRSLVCYLDPQLPQPDTIEQVADAVLPAQSLTTGNLRGTELKFAFNVTSEHVLNLIRLKLVTESRRSTWHSGRNGSPTITRASVVQLLKLRRIL